MLEKFEGGPTRPEKTPKELITEFKADFEKYVKENSELAEKLKRELLDMVGLEESELVDKSTGFDMSFVKIPLNELSGFNTSCGTKGNKPFSKEVIDFLKSHGVESVIALGDNNNLEISSAAIRISEEDAEKFAEEINKNKGSLRAEPSKVEGWSIFESE